MVQCQSDSNGDHTHDARYHISTVNHLGGWFQNFGVSGAVAKIGMDSTGFAFYAPSITLSNATGGSGTNPRLWLNGANDRIYLTATAGDYRLENLTRDDDIANVVGVDYTNGRLYIKSAELPPAPGIDDVLASGQFFTNDRFFETDGYAFEIQNGGRDYFKMDFTTKLFGIGDIEGRANGNSFNVDEEGII